MKTTTCLWACLVLGFLCFCDVNGESAASKNGTSQTAKPGSVYSANAMRRVSEPLTNGHEKDEIRVIYTHKGNAKRASCSFPFKYKGKFYHECTKDGGTRTPWCSTTPDYRVDKKWGYCNEDPLPSARCRDRSHSCGMRAVKGNCMINVLRMKTECPLSCGWCTWGGTDGGKPCVFPFVYNGNEYYKCPKAKMKKYKQHTWCGTTDNVDKDAKWGLCYPAMYESIQDLNAPFLLHGECDDRSSDCRPWIKRGYCYIQSVKKICPNSCKVCAPTQLVKSKICKNHKRKCGRWVRRGLCDSNPVFMYAYCRLSCHLCAKDNGRSVKDQYPRSCRKIVREKQCQEKGLFTLEACRKSCNFAGFIDGVKYIDKDSFCPVFADEGYCERGKNEAAVFFRSQCPYSCFKTTNGGPLE